MLARRFTIVCLLAAIFGIGLSNLVAQSTRHSLWEAGGILPPCHFACMPREMHF